jgi:putative mRNA 3-end processing factor
LNSTNHPPLIELNARGLYCAAGDFYIDPWGAVERAVITHAHADHVRPGSAHYLTAASGAPLARERLGPDAHVQGVPYGRRILMGRVTVSLHPAGHLLGSAQVRVESAEGEVWVVSGDYKTQPDRTCEPFELVPCDTFITESTFGLPIYKWPPEEEVFAQINAWWRENQAQGRASVLFAYALGKAQRVLGGIDPSIGPILVHGAVSRFLPAYKAAGIELPPVQRSDGEVPRELWSQALIVAPPGAVNTPWMHKFDSASTAFASGWMQLRAARRRRALDRGFILSDHVDWDSLMSTIRATGARRVLVTHGYADEVVKYLREQGLDAQALNTHFMGEIEEAPSGLPEKEESES